MVVFGFGEGHVMGYDVEGAGARGFPEGWLLFFFESGVLVVAVAVGVHVDFEVRAGDLRSRLGARGSSAVGVHGEAAEGVVEIWGWGPSDAYLGVYLGVEGCV